MESSVVEAKRTQLRRRMRFPRCNEAELLKVRSIASKELGGRTVFDCRAAEASYTLKMEKLLFGVINTMYFIADFSTHQSIIFDFTL